MLALSVVGTSQLTISFMDTKEADSESDEEDQDRRRRRRGPPRDRVAEKKAKREKLRVDIAKAAGGELEGKL